MPKLRLITFTLLALSAATAVHAEEKRYVSDELNTWVRSGPGDNYRLVGTINAGEEVSVLQTNDSTSYAQIRDSNGRTAWIPLQKKVAGSDSVINALKDENQKLKNELVVAQKKVNAANLQLDDKQRTIIMQWFMYGGGVLGVGLLLGLVLPHLVPSRKRKDRWMN